jgi:solute carrier family 50 protein (sugar transporter)
MPIILACASKTLTTLTQTGLIATSLSVATYMTCLDTVQLTLRTRDSETVNMGLTVASLVNGMIWMVYAMLVRDIYVFIPNSCALIIAAINLNLYQWTQGKLDNHHWLILFL